MHGQMCRGQCVWCAQNRGARPLWLGGVSVAVATTNAEPGAAAGASLGLVRMMPQAILENLTGARDPVLCSSATGALGDLRHLHPSLGLSLLICEIGPVTGLL